MSVIYKSDNSAVCCQTVYRIDFSVHVMHNIYTHFNQPKTLL